MKDAYHPAEFSDELNRLALKVANLVAAHETGVTVSFVTLTVRDK